MGRREGRGHSLAGQKSRERGHRREVRRQSAERPVQGRMGRNKRTKERRGLGWAIIEQRTDRTACRVHT
jgi:hypothetical protein